MNDYSQQNFDDDLEEETSHPVDPFRLSESVLWGTDWTVKTILQQIEDGNIDLTPNFQRRDAWPVATKFRFIESVALQMPIPQIVLAEDRSRKGRFVVLDGKQRLLTLAQFAGELSEESLIRTNSRIELPIKLGQLSILSDLRGHTYASLADSEHLAHWRRQFDNHTIRCVIIRGASNEDYLYEVFIRLNSGSLKLSPQELRQAMHPGAFSDFLAFRSAECAPLKQILDITEPDFRFRDVDLYLRLLAFYLAPDRYRGDLREFLDGTHTEINSQWGAVSQRVELAAASVEESLRFLVENANGDGTLVARRWKSGKRIPVVNRAVLDVLVKSTVDQRNRRSIEESGIRLSDVVKELCENSPSFVEAISTTTKSLEAWRSRQRIWNTELRARLTNPSVWVE